MGRYQRKSFSSSPRFSRAVFALPIVILALVLFAMLVPLISLMLSRESRDTVAELGDTMSFQLAEVALARVQDELDQSATLFDGVIAGNVPAGFRRDVEYNALGGTYKILLSSSPVLNQVKIVAWGRHSATGRVRSMEAGYSRIGETPSIAVYGFTALNFDANAEVHWGSIVSYSPSTMTAMSATFPRKFAGGPIINRPMTSPFTDNVEYFAKREDVGLTPEVDRDYYAARAKASSIPTSVGSPYKGELFNNKVPATPAVSTPVAGTGYFLISENKPAVGGEIIFRRAAAGTPGVDRYYLRSSSSVIYLDIGTITGKIVLEDAFLEVEALIAARPPSLAVGGAGSVISRTGQGITLPVSIPEGANAEYQESAAQTRWASDFEAIYQSHTTYNIPDVKVKGLVITTSNGCGATDPFLTIVGAALEQTKPTTALRWKVYYDESVGNNAKFALPPSIGAVNITRTYWKETNEPW